MRWPLFRMVYRCLIFPQFWLENLPILLPVLSDFRPLWADIAQLLLPFRNVLLSGIHYEYLWSVISRESKIYVQAKVLKCALNYRLLNINFLPKEIESDQYDFIQISLIIILRQLLIPELHLSPCWLPAATVTHGNFKWQLNNSCWHFPSGRCWKMARDRASREILSLTLAASMALHRLCCCTCQLGAPRCRACDPMISVHGSWNRKQPHRG